MIIGRLTVLGVATAVMLALATTGSANAGQTGYKFEKHHFDRDHNRHYGDWKREGGDDRGNKDHNGDNGGYAGNGSNDGGRCAPPPPHCCPMSAPHGKVG